jgi:hypothetical protein
LENWVERRWPPEQIVEGYSLTIELRHLPPAFAHSFRGLWGHHFGDTRGAFAAFAAFAATLGRRCHRMDSISGAQADLLNALYQANHTGLLAGQLGAPYFIPTLVVPLLLITHGLAFRILLQHQNESAVRESRHPA